MPTTLCCQPKGVHLFVLLIRSRKSSSDKGKRFLRTKINPIKNINAITPINNSTEPNTGTMYTNKLIVSAPIAMTHIIQINVIQKGLYNLMAKIF